MECSFTTPLSSPSHASHVSPTSIPLSLPALARCITRQHGHAKHTPSHKTNLVCSAKRRVIGDGGDGGFLDYMQGGPKLRKWYGAADLPGDGQRPPENNPKNDPPPPPPAAEEPELPLESVLVVDADSPMGELVVLQLILARASVRILVKDAAAATVAFGPYVQPIEGSVNDPTAVRKALNGAKTVIIPSKTGALLPELTNAATSGRARDVVLISSAGAPGGGLLSVFDADGAVLRDTAREASVREAVPGCTVVRAARIRDVPGGVSGIAIASVAPTVVAEGEVCREDMARVVAAAALWEKTRGEVLHVGNVAGSPPVDIGAQLASVLS